jgi:hypothetical protein
MKAVRKHSAVTVRAAPPSVCEEMSGCRRHHGHEAFTEHGPQASQGRHHDRLAIGVAKLAQAVGGRKLQTRRDLPPLGGPRADFFSAQRKKNKSRFQVEDTWEAGVENEPAPAVNLNSKR